MSDYKALADLIYPDVTGTIEDLYRRYPGRELDKSAQVTRFGVSPIGPLHVGLLFQALINKSVAHQSHGVYIVRIEDTNLDALVEGSEQDIIKTLTYADMLPDEGPYKCEADTEERGFYGPYKQTIRMPIYKIFAKYLVSTGNAYPCFMGKDELDRIREQQQLSGEEYGVYGEWARSRMLDLPQITELLGRGMPFVIRWKAKECVSKQVTIDDIVHGRLTLTANDKDVILVKSSGLPTYHLAHPVDDSLMQITTVIRHAELLPFTPLHIDVFWAIGRPPPTYAHVPHISRTDGRSHRRISRNRDPELAIAQFRSMGYPMESLAEYLLSLANPNFEGWRARHPELSYADFPFQLSKVPSADIVFDIDKYRSIARKQIAARDPSYNYRQLLAWASEFQPSLKALLERDSSSAIAILGLAATRKDITKWADFSEQYGFFFDEIYQPLIPKGYDHMPTMPRQDILAILDYLIDTAPRALGESKEAWSERMRAYAANTAFCLSLNPDRGRNGSSKNLQIVMGVLRSALTARETSPDLHAVMLILGQGRVIDRLQMMLDHLSSPNRITLSNQ